MSLICALCCRTGKMKKSMFTKVISVDVEEKIKESYEDIHGVPVSTILLNQQVHKQCYGKYFHHYINRRKNKQSSTKPSHCLSSCRLPLADHTNYQFPSSLSTASSINRYSEATSIDEVDVLVDLTHTSPSQTNKNRTLALSSSLSSCSITENLDSTAYDKTTRLQCSHSEQSCHVDDVTDLQEDFSNSIFCIDHESSPIISSSIEQIHQKTDADDVIDIREDMLNSSSYNNYICSKVLQSEQSYTNTDIIISENFLDSSCYIDQTFSPSIELSTIESPCILSSPRGSSSVQDIHGKQISKIKTKLSKARKRIDFDEFINLNDTDQSSPKIIGTKRISSRLHSRCRINNQRQPSNHTTFPIDNKKKSFLYYDAYSELCGWLQNLLQSGLLVSLMMVQDKYKEILQLRNEMVTAGMIRTISIRDRLRTKFKNQILFTKVSNRQGLFISWNDLSTITQATLVNSSTLDDTYTFESSNIYKDSEKVIDKEEQSKKLFESIELLRELIRENIHYLKQVKNNSSLAEFTSGLFWDCIPMLLKNFIGLLTTNDDQFQQFKTDYEYPNLFNQDMYKLSDKSLKISSIAYDIISTRYDSLSTPKHLLLGNELYHHIRSSHLLNIMNRFRHTCSYETMIRLQKKAANEVSKLSLTDLPATVQQQHSFAITVADNFDMNIGSLHGENSIHILNRIIVQTPVNDELKFDVNECLNDLCGNVVLAVDESNFDLLSNHNIGNSTTCTTSNTTKMIEPYVPFKDNSYRDILLAYGLLKYVYNTNNNFEKLFDNEIQKNVPLIAGFFAAYLPNIDRPLAKITFLSPINDDPSALRTSQLCLQATKTSLIDSHYQQEAIIVVDEKIYANCIKAKRLNEADNKSIFLYPGDFHIMKNYMVIIWEVLNGSGIEDVLGLIYKAAAHRAILNVHNFNYSLRCCKLVYTALLMVFLDSFIKTLSSTSVSTTTCIIEEIKDVLKLLPSDYVVNSKKQEWFSTFINKINDLKLSDILDQWASKQCEINKAFQFWFFILREILEPLILMYISIRSSNFKGRCAALCSMAPIFFSTNHRNYARLASQHLLDLQSCSTYLHERLERSFTVTRTNRPFSGIALDQAIECSINKYGKGKGGLSGKLNLESIETWCKSFAFRSTLSSIINDIATIERTNNSIDAHVECSLFRMTQDNKDLSIITEALIEENLFKQDNIHVRKIMNGKIIHEKIIENFVTMYERGVQRMHSFIQERYIDHSINIEERLSAMIRYKLSDPYVPIDEQRLKKKIDNNIIMANIVKTADNTIKHIISLSCFRELDMVSLFGHEFSPALLSLCDNKNFNLFNQQQKSEIVKLFEKECPIAFSTKNPTINNGKWALIIDGGPLLEIRPLKPNGTIFDYAKQLLSNTIIPEFRNYDRIDIVFDTDQSFYEFVHKNRAKLAGVVRSCWSQGELIALLPVHKHLVIAGPQQDTIKLINNKNSPLASSSEILIDLESNHIEADTRIFLHTYDIQMDHDNGKFNGIMIQSNDTDIFILSIAHIKLIMLSNYFIKKFNTSTKLSTFINIKEIEKLIKIKWNITEPSVFLPLHAISGCDSTSFTRNITKINYFVTYLSNPNQFQDLIHFGNALSITSEPLKAAEKLLLSCYTNSRGFKSSISQTLSSSSATTKSSHETSLNNLRKIMALKYFKNSTSDICIKLPPTSNSFNQHCQRAWRQVYIWRKAFEQYDLMNSYPIENYGYQRTDDGQLMIQWMTISPASDDITLSTCAKCTTGCQRCRCATNNLPCTPFCGCSIDQCKNRRNIRIKTPSTETKRPKPVPSLINKCSFHYDDYDEDTEDDIQMENQTDIDYENDIENNDKDVLNSVYDNDSDASSNSSTKSNCLNNDNIQSNLMDISISIEHNYCRQLTSSPLQSFYVSKPFDNSFSQISASTNAELIYNFDKKFNETVTSTTSNKRKSVANRNTSSQSTPSQIIPRKKML